jgi:hypothetical protein
MAKKHTGRCACGNVQFEFDSEPDFIATCHCLDCKKASGGEAATFFAVPENDFTLVKGTPKGFVSVAASGKRLERVFCPDCGARLYTRNLESFPGAVFATIGSLDNPEAFTPKLEMFVKRRLDWAKPLGLPEFAEMPKG